MKFGLILLTVFLLETIGVSEARRYVQSKEPSINNFTPLELKAALTTGKIPQSVADKILSIPPSSECDSDFLDRQDRIDKILLSSLPNNLLDVMLMKQANALPPWLHTLPQGMQKKIKEVNRSRSKTWAHKLLELEVINAEISRMNLTYGEGGRPIGNRVGQLEYKLGPMSVVPCLGLPDPAKTSERNESSEVFELYSKELQYDMEEKPSDFNKKNGEKEEDRITELQPPTQVPMCLSQSGHYPFSNGIGKGFIFGGKNCAPNNVSSVVAKGLE